jgi:hypothetical protein
MRNGGGLAGKKRKEITSKAAMSKGNSIYISFDFTGD